MASLTVLQFKLYEMEKKKEIPRQDAQFFISSIESLMTHDVITLEQSIDKMYKDFNDLGDFKEHLKTATVSYNNKFLFDYVDNFNSVYGDVYEVIEEIREELLEETKTR